METVFVIVIAAFVFLLILRMIFGGKRSRRDDGYDYWDSDKDDNNDDAGDD